MVASQSRFRVPDNLRWAPNVTTRFAGSRSLALRPKAVALSCQAFQPRQRPQMAPCTVRVSGGVGVGAANATATAPATEWRPMAPYGPHFLRYEPGVDASAWPPLPAPMTRFALPPGQVMELKFELVDTPDVVAMYMDDLEYDLVTKK
jgi:hypothetical protein